MKYKQISAFTLVEVLTGIVVLSVISTCSWLAVSTLFRGEQLTRNRTVAINLLQKSQEELRKASLTYYDILENCQFPGPSFIANTNNPCGLQALSTDFIGYTRKVTITTQNGSSEIKQATITVNWIDQGNTLAMYSAVLLTRPPDPLPGNIFGTVRSSGQNNALINGATITITPVNTGPTSIALSQSSLGSVKNENYDFNTPTGSFNLPVGSWHLTAKHSSYHDYTHPALITVTSNTETKVDFLMDPKPADAIIRIRLINAITPSSLTNFFNGSFYIRDDYEQTLQIIHTANNVTAGNYIIPFNDTNPRSFTINTLGAYRSGYAGKPSCSGYPYDINGWSSAVVDATNTISTCGNPYNGSITSDRITVNSGNSISVNIPLYPVPTATIKGKVVDQNNMPLSGAQIYAQWPTSDWWYTNGSNAFATSDNNGDYTFVVPAVQEMFANDSTGLLKVQARRSMTFIGCCNVQQSSTQYSNWVSTNNLFTGSIINIANLVIPSGNSINCGNVQGNVKDGLTGSGVNNVNISIQGVGTITAGSGDYLYQCPNASYQLPAGSAQFYATQNQYYAYTSAGNMWYSPAPSVNVQANQMITYDAKIWPIGRGTVIVNVLDAGSNYPINGAQVKLTTYNGTQSTLITAANGKATFVNTLETWPPINLPNDTYYQQNSQSHTLTVVPPSTTYSSYAGSIPILQKNDTLTIDVKLIPSGGT